MNCQTPAIKHAATRNVNNSFDIEKVKLDILPEDIP
jgi:hypothetical protein